MKVIPTKFVYSTLPSKIYVGHPGHQVNSPLNDDGNFLLHNPPFSLNYSFHVFLTDLDFLSAALCVRDGVALPSGLRCQPAILSGYTLCQ